jgi:hexosaminidase
MHLVLGGVLCLLHCAFALKSSSPALRVLPPPRSIALDGPPLPVSSFALEAASEGALHPYIALAFERFLQRLPAAPAALPLGAVQSRVSVAVASGELRLDELTDYSYTLRATPDGAVRIASPTVYGAVYALESLAQLVEAGGALQHERIAIADAPNFAWRGLMVDSGRRFFPMPTLLNLLDTMLAVKLNVLHLHASDECRFSVESKLFPNLTASLQGALGGFYTQDDIRDLVSNATARGIRVVPEFDIPSHSRGLRSIKSEGIVFCTDAPTQSQIYGDPANSTFNTLVTLFNEISALFPDPVFHIGADETSALGPCTVDSTFALERRVLSHLEGTLGKTAAGWEEILFDAGAATNKTIVYAWSRHTPQEIISAGRRAVDSASGDFYMTEPAGPYPGGWKNFWYDISTGVAPADIGMLLGSEMSMWTDSYCSPVEAGGQQCGAYSGPPQVGAPLFPPERDAEWERSIGGMMFPRGFVGAMAYWNYNSSIDSQSDAFVTALWDLNDKILAAGGASCPTKCVRCS